jgi:hypothetical protein
VFREHSGNGAGGFFFFLKGRENSLGVVDFFFKEERVCVCTVVTLGHASEVQGQALPRHTGIQTDRQTDRQTHRHTHILDSLRKKKNNNNYII